MTSKGVAAATHRGDTDRACEPVIQITNQACSHGVSLASQSRSHQWPRCARSCGRSFQDSVDSRFSIRDRGGRRQCSQRDLAARGESHLLTLPGTIKLTAFERRSRGEAGLARCSERLIGSQTKRISMRRAATAAANRPCSPRGVPTPISCRMRRPRLKPLA